MLEQRRPDVVIVTTVDAFHHLYIITAMQNGCDVITEKPMTIDAEKVGAVLSAVEQTATPPDGDVQLSLCAGLHPSATGHRRRSDRGTAPGGLLLDAGHQPRRRLLPALAPGEAHVRRSARPQGQSSLRPGQLVDRVLARDGVRPGLARVLRAQGGDGPGRELLPTAGTRATSTDDPFALDLDRSEMLQGLYRDAEAETGTFGTATSSAKTSPSRTRWW